MSLLVTDFTYLEGRDGELLVKELATVDSNRNRMSSYIFKKPYEWANSRKDSYSNGQNATFVGSASTNPFHFYHYEMINLVLYINGVQHPSEPLTMDCSSPFGATRSYETLFSSTGIHHDVRAHMIILQMFTKVFYVLDLYLTPDREADEEHVSLLRQGIVGIEARFKKPLPEYVTYILYAEFPGHVEIDNSMNVTVE